MLPRGREAAETAVGVADQRFNEKDGDEGGERGCLEVAAVVSISYWAIPIAISSNVLTPILVTDQ